MWAQPQLQVRVAREQSDIQITRGTRIPHKMMLRASLEANGERDQLRPVVRLGVGRGLLPGAEDQPSLEGEQAPQINDSQSPVKSLILSVQSGTARTLDE
jgi:hypothetical protein